MWWKGTHYMIDWLSFSAETTTMLNWLMKGSKSSLPEPTALQTLRAKQIEQLRYFDSRCFEVPPLFCLTVNCWTDLANWQWKWSHSHMRMVSNLLTCWKWVLSQMYCCNIIRLLLCPRKSGAVFHQMTMPPFNRERYFRETTMPPKLGTRVR